MIQALYNAASGIGLGFRKLEASANNLANQGTDGFRRSEVVGTARPGGGVSARVVEGADDGPLADVVQTILARHSVAANAAVFRRANAATGTLVDLLG